jgi:hypothetical protein
MVDSYIFCSTVPSSPPDDIRCAALTSTSLQVSWQPPVANHQNGLLQGYKVSFEPVLDDYSNGKFFALKVYS